MERFSMLLIMTAHVRYTPCKVFNAVDHDCARAGHPLQGLHPENYVWI